MSLTLKDVRPKTSKQLKQCLTILSHVKVVHDKHTKYETFTGRCFNVNHRLRRERLVFAGT